MNHIVWAWLPELERLYELEPGTVQKYDNFRRCVHCDKINTVEAASDDAIRKHQPFDLEFRIVCPSGEFRWMVARGKAIYHNTGEPARVLGNHVDITDRKQTEEALHHAV